MDAEVQINGGTVETGTEELVSVIIPVYKVEKYLSKCVESVLSQTYRNLQIILVDDGSPDRCGAMCDDYAERDTRIEVIHKANGGLASARNAGLKSAKGEWIVWVDSDDWIEEDMVEYLLKGVIQNQADVAVCGRYEVYTKKKYKFGVSKVSVSTPEEVLRMLLDTQNRQIENFVWDKMWRKSLYEGILFPEGKVFEDFFVTFRLLERANVIACLPDAKYYYFQRPGSIMQNMSLINKLNRYEAAQTRYDGMIKDWPQFEKLLVDRCINMAVNVWQDYCSAPKQERVNAKEKLREVSRFLRPYIKSGISPENLGQAGHMIVKLIPYPYFWSYDLAWMIQRLSKIKKSSIRKCVSNWRQRPKQLWVSVCNATKHFIKNGWARRNARYIKGYRTLAIKENLILYESFWGRGAMCNPYALFEFLLHDPAYASFEHIWVLDSFKEYSDMIERYRKYSNVRFVHYMQRDYLKALSEAKYLFNNTAFPQFYIKREGQVYINTWHGIPLKKLGPDMPDGRIESGNAIRNFLQTDYIISANLFLSQIYKNTYSLEQLYKGKIVEEGYPRLDTLVRYTKEECVEKLRRMGVTILEKKKIILYAPTWREEKKGKKASNSILQEYKSVKTKIETECPEYQVLIKVHQYVYQAIKGKQYPAYIIPATIDANEVLPVADILLGDYSSIYFDYLYFERPILFYIPDIARYSDHRGLYMPIDSLPGPASEDLNEVIHWLLDIDNVTMQYREKILATKKWCCDYEVGTIAKHISEIILEGKVRGHVLAEMTHTKKTVLLQTNALKDESSIFALNCLLDKMNLDQYDVTLALPMPTTWKERELYERFDRRIRVIVQNRYISVTWWDDVKNRLICTNGFSGWRKKYFPMQIYQEEARKRYFDYHFDFAVHFGNGNFTDRMVVALVRGENPYAEDFNLVEQNSQALKALLKEID